MGKPWRSLETDGRDSTLPDLRWGDLRFLGALPDIAITVRSPCWKLKLYAEKCGSIRRFSGSLSIGYSIHSDRNTLPIQKIHMFI